MNEKVLYLEPVGGIAGDMFLAAALDLGVALQDVQQRLAGLKLPPFVLHTQRQTRHELSGTHLDVRVASPETHTHRALSDIRHLIEEAPSLSPWVREKALAVFQLLGEAEACIHQVPVEDIHFHEVGAVDSIVDICGAACVLELLGKPVLYSAAPPLGSGSVKAAHGNLPVPAPATLELLKGCPVRFEGTGELTTPTGAALLKAFARFEAPPPMGVEHVGYGVGTRDFPDRPNVLRMTLGHVSAATAPGLFVVEANLDDASPQLLGALTEKLLAQGALDAWVTPATMKKGRPGHVLGLLSTGARKTALTDTVLRESTSLGVRSYAVERTVLERSFETVTTSVGEVRMKLGLRDGQVWNAQAEFEDCRVLAEQHGVPLKQVMAEALAAFFGKKPSSG